MRTHSSPRSNTYNVIRDAADSRQPIRALYEGKWRELCPYVVGISKDGHEQALFYQIGGHSKRGLDPIGSDRNWRCFPICRLTLATIIDVPWGVPNKKPRKSQTCVRQVDVKVPPVK